MKKKGKAKGRPPRGPQADLGPPWDIENIDPEEVSRSDLPPRMRPVSDAIGIPETLRLSKHFGGAFLYIPKLYDAARRIRNRRIRAEYAQKARSKELARKYGLSQVQICQILRRGTTKPEG